MEYLVQDDSDELLVIFQMIVLDEIRFRENFSSTKQALRRSLLTLAFEKYFKIKINSNITMTEIYGITPLENNLYSDIFNSLHIT